MRPTTYDFEENSVENNYQRMITKHHYLTSTCIIVTLVSTLLSLLSAVGHTLIFGRIFPFYTTPHHTKLVLITFWKILPNGPRSGHMWESQPLLSDGQVVFPRVLRFSPTVDADISEIFLKGP